MHWLQFGSHLPATRLMNRTETAALPTTSALRMGARLEVLARLAGYPGLEFEPVVESAIDEVGGDQLAAFRDHMIALNQDEREELYTATFDVTPRCVPYVSIHLFGEENFKRGEFMAALHSRYELLGFDTGGELPDHLSILLRYASALAEPERRELVEYCLLGPLGKMIESLAGGHPYGFLLQAVEEVFHAHYPALQPALSPLEQMRQHGICPAVADGCNCGPSAAPIRDGPTDLDSPAEAGTWPSFPLHPTPDPTD